MNAENKLVFEELPPPILFPEVGSRMLSIVIENNLPGNSWLEIQKNIFRFAVIWDESIVVRMVFREFLFAEVIWEKEL